MTTSTAARRRGTPAQSDIRSATDLTLRLGATRIRRARTARLYFGVDPMGQKLGAIEPWAPGEEPRFDEPRSPRATMPTSSWRACPPDAWSPAGRDGICRWRRSIARDLPPLPSDPSVGAQGRRREGGQSIAAKGEVTGEGQRPMTPAERLGLDEASRAKAEKCLAEAIYFEARGEAVRGQMAVAQVVLNRAFSG